MSKYQITIDMDKKCSKCGKGGAITENKAGLCMDCIAKIMAKKAANNLINSDRNKPRQVI